MGRQRDPGAGPRRIRLTDQALVAVTVARRAAAERGGAAGALDLLLGLGAEPDGVGGQMLRGSGDAVALAQRASHGRPAAGMSLERLGAAASDAAAPRPAGTADLLRGMLATSELDDLLAACGFDRVALRRGADEAVDGPSGWRDHPWLAQVPAAVRAAFHVHSSHRAAGNETAGLGGGHDHGLQPAAALALARTHAVAGRALALVVAAAVLPDEDVAPLVPGGPSALVGALATRYRRGAGRLSEADAQAVVTAARGWRGTDQVSLADLVRAAAVAGGSATSAMLEGARRAAGQEG